MNGEVTAPIFSQFLEYLVTFEHFPFTLAELHNYIEKYKLIDVQAGGPLAIEVYQFLYIFFIRILNYIYKGYNNNGINK